MFVLLFHSRRKLRDSKSTQPDLAGTEQTPREKKAYRCTSQSQAIGHSGSFRKAANQAHQAGCSGR
ncbi:hypothetical protein, partial [Accumulibacter sp.]|uniref:hypothetical protein n=1 Tax=Accumulibacter sp. TaxID=2053492 RepID=UPI0028C4E971